MKCIVFLHIYEGEKGREREGESNDYFYMYMEFFPYKTYCNLNLLFLLQI